MIVALLCVGMTAGPAAAALDPRTLILVQSGVPDGFTPVRAESHATPNAVFERGGLRQLIVRSERITGYAGVYEKRSGGRVATIRSSGDLCRGVDGAHVLLSWLDRRQRRYNARRVKLGGRPFGRARAGVGAESWIYWAGEPSRYTLIVWRQRRAVATLQSWGIGRTITLMLARRQERRISVALG
jgi:hypothetical protein